MNLYAQDTELFYRLHRSVLAYANRYLILPQVVSVQDVAKLPLEQVVKLRE